MEGTPGARRPGSQENQRIQGGILSWGSKCYREAKVRTSKRHWLPLECKRLVSLTGAARLTSRPSGGKQHDWVGGGASGLALLGPPHLWRGWPLTRSYWVTATRPGKGGRGKGRLGHGRTVEKPGRVSTPGREQGPVLRSEDRSRREHMTRTTDPRWQDGVCSPGRWGVGSGPRARRTGPRKAWARGLR